MSIMYNPSITGLFLDSLIAVDGRVRVVGNQRLAGVSADDLQEVGGDVQVGENQDLVAFIARRLVTVGGGVFVFNNANLTQIWMDNLRIVTGLVEIAYNEKLYALRFNGFPSLACVGDTRSESLRDCHPSLQARIGAAAAAATAAAAAAWDFTGCRSTFGKQLNQDVVLRHANSAVVCNMLKGETRINGNLFITGSSLTNLTCLSSLLVSAFFFHDCIVVR